MTEARLLLVDISKLCTEAGLPEEYFLDAPRAGGGTGKDTADGNEIGKLWELPRVEGGRRDGGGGGALTLSERGRPVDTIDPAIETLSSSSGFRGSLADLLRFSFESDTIWLRRRAIGGAGGVFLLIDEDGDGGSGVFPAASLSKTDSRSKSWLALFGAGGSGLLRSVKEGLEYTGLGLEWFCVAETGVGGFELFVEGSSLSSTLIIRPCLELGGGGLCLPDIEC
jgi:hypothetical protein